MLHQPLQLVLPLLLVVLGVQQVLGEGHRDFSERARAGGKWERHESPSGSFRTHGGRLGSVGDRDLNLYTGLDVDRGDLFDDLRGRVEVNNPLVDPHLELVPRLGTLT